MLEDCTVSDSENQTLSLLKNLPDLPRSVLLTMMQEQLTKVPFDLGVRCGGQIHDQEDELRARGNRKSNSAPEGCMRQKSAKKGKRVSWTEKNEVFYLATPSTRWKERCSSAIARFPSPALQLSTSSLRHDNQEKASSLLPPARCSRLHVRRTSSGTGHRIVLAPPPQSLCGKVESGASKEFLPTSFVKTRANVLEPNKYHLPPLATNRTVTTRKVKPQG